MNLVVLYILIFNFYLNWIYAEPGLLCVQLQAAPLQELPLGLAEVDHWAVDENPPVLLVPLDRVEISTAGPVHRGVTYRWNYPTLGHQTLDTLAVSCATLHCTALYSTALNCTALLYSTVACTAPVDSTSQLYTLPSKSLHFIPEAGQGQAGQEQEQEQGQGQGQGPG